MLGSGGWMTSADGFVAGALRRRGDAVLHDEGGERAIERQRSRLRIGLAGRMIALIAGFVLIAQIMIFVPAIANMRFNWLRNHLSAAAVAATTLESLPSDSISPAFASDLLKSAGAREIAVAQAGTWRILASRGTPAKADATYDLRTASWPDLLRAAFATLVAPPGRVLTLLSAAPVGGRVLAVTIDEAPLTEAMHGFAQRILIYSLIVSVIVASLAALALHRMILRPVRRLTGSIVDFGADPGDRRRIIEPSGRAHEIGQAEQALAMMQAALVIELGQKKHLADLGLAVAKINHDMRNMLSSAQILSDRLAGVPDPLAQRLAPKLVATLDRAIRFCQATLTYGRAADEPPRPRVLNLRSVVAEAAETVAPTAHGHGMDFRARIENAVPADLELTADAEQIFRILMNLLRNGVEALERAGAAPGRLPVVEVRAWTDGAITTIEVSDTGPGIPPAIRGKVFSAFQTSSRPGGTGLGLAIVADLVRAHGGTVELAPDREDAGALFRIKLPWLPAVG